MRAGNRAIMEGCPDFRMLELKTLDFNKSFSSQRVEADSFDIVYGVNSLHAAEDLLRSIANVSYALKPGGLLVLSECARPKKKGLLFQEFIFNLLDNYRDMELSNIRPMPGFLDVQTWQIIFEAANMKKIDYLTNIDSINKSASINGDQVFAMIIKGEKKP